MATPDYQVDEYFNGHDTTKLYTHDPMLDLVNERLCAPPCLGPKATLQNYFEDVPEFVEIPPSPCLSDVSINWANGTPPYPGDEPYEAWASARPMYTGTSHQQAVVGTEGGTSNMHIRFPADFQGKTIAAHFCGDH